MANPILREIPCIPCTKTELDFESIPPTQMGITDDYIIVTGPKAALDNDGPLEFVFEASGDDYTDLSECYLKIKLKLLNSDGSNLAHTAAGAAAAQATVVPCNLGFHSLFRQVDLVLNDTLVQSSQDSYPYKAYLSTLLSYGKGVKESWLKTLEGYYEDQANKFDAADNTSIELKSKLCQNSKLFEWKGRIQMDLTLQSRLIPNGMSVKFLLTRSKPEFFIMSHEGGDAKYKVHIDSAAMEVRRVKIAPEEQLRLEKVLTTKGAIYPTAHVITKTFTVANGARSISLDSMFVGEIPNKIIVGLVRNDAYHGSYGLNPFRFDHMNITNASLFVDGTRVPSLGYEIDMENNIYTDVFQALHKHCGVYPHDGSNNITEELFAGGAFLLVFDLTPDNAGDGVSYVTSKRRGTVKGSFRFSQALTHTTTVLALAQFDSNIFIDGNRSVTSDYAI